jgi:Tol biopolymer transport system component
MAFRGWAPGGPASIVNPADTWVMQADGSAPRRITAAERLGDSYAQPTWSPRPADGSYRLAFARERRNEAGYMTSNLESVRADGTDRRVITPAGDVVDAEPSWSPDGRTIAFTRYGNGAMGDVWLVRADGDDARPLMAPSVEPGGAQRAPAWSPDGRFPAFASNHEILGTCFAWQLYTVRADGTELTRRTSDRNDKGNPVWVRR